MKYIVLLLSLALNSLALHAVADDSTSVDFNRDVRPILSGRCFTCHGPDPETREAGLRLDRRDAAVRELESGETAIVPGHPTMSTLVERITADEDYLRMPPPEQGPALTGKEVEVLRQWIADGAKYEKHWSFVAPERPQPPAVDNVDWCRNPIDNFVLRKLEATGLRPSPEADRHTLIRRLSIDLTGLPPSPEEIEPFVTDPSPSAYEDLVDRLLASPAYGERWARIWLDLARYADSAGYADDPPRVIWKYRDWVIKALNENKLFDEFTIEQLAGDLLPDPTDDQLIATAFHRNTMTNSEGGTDDEEFRSAAIVDRVNTTMQVWMGLTMACAQCHTHKYDPITQEEYFQVYDIFNQTEDADRRDESPLLSTWTPSLLEQKESLNKQIASLKSKLDQLTREDVDTPAVLTAEGPLTARYVRIDLPGKSEFLSLAEVQIFSNGDNVALKGTATQSSTDYDGPATLAIDGNTDGHFFEAASTTHTKKDETPWLQIDLGEPKKIDNIVVWNRNDSPGIGARLNGFRVILLDADGKPVWVRRSIQANEKDTLVEVPTDASSITAGEKEALVEYLGHTSPESEMITKQIADLEKRVNNLKPVTTPIMRELPADKQRTTRIQIRGNFLDLGSEVEAGVPKEFHPLESENPDRLALAKWIVDSANPLTARVIANRNWEALFGIGLVETSEDFGMQGELPSHPRLLDWLATELLRLDWDQKAFLKTIVMSATYRQSSSTTPEMIANDPNNRLLARGPRFRLSAEMIRDQALAISGLLSDKMYGPSVNPPRPKLGLRAAFGGSTDWETSQGEDKFRRGLYTTWRRSLPYPSMDAFDAPSREVCTVRRIRTNTPLQALVTLNDPVYIEAAQALGGRIVNEGGESLEERLQYGFLLCTARPPTESELTVLVSTYQQVREQYSAQSDHLDKLALIGAGKTAGLAPAEQAAWTTMANVLLNLDETLTRR